MYKTPERTTDIVTGEPIEQKENPSSLFSSAPLKEVLREVEAEYIRASSMNAPFNSAHEGYGVILEELDELWDEIKKKRRLRDPKLMKEEAIQVAAMAVRFIYDICNNGRG